MASVTLRILFFACMVVSRADDELRDFDFERDPDEVMIAQESRHYQTIVKPPVRIVKPTGVTNSHRPQYNLDSMESDGLDDYYEPTSMRSVVKNYKSSSKIRAKEGIVQEAVLRAMERKDQVGKFAQILPIIRAMSGPQRLALASLVASQVTTPGKPLTLAQVRSTFGTSNTTDQMLPVLLEITNLIQGAVSVGNEADVNPYPTQLIRRYTENIDGRHPAQIDDTPMRQPLPTAQLLKAVNYEVKLPKPTAQFFKADNREVKLPVTTAQLLRRSYIEDTDIDDDMFEVGVQPATTQIKPRIRRIIPQTQRNTVIADTDKDNKNETKQANARENFNVTNDDNKNTTISSSMEAPSPVMRMQSSNVSRSMSVDNGTLDLMADSTNQTLAQDLPVAEKLRALNRYIDRKGSLIRRGTYPPKPYTAAVTRRTTVDPPAGRRRPAPPRKLPPSQENKCELFTNTLCLHAEDYPTEAIVQSIRRNKAAAGALLADFKDPGEGALDGVTAAQESKYTADHYLISNRRGDTASRDFASAGEAGFMCPSTVKYARPQRARATSGHWKYIVNTGEHTQTLRLEKCLKPKESCTYLTDNFKSKCVQVYNYHRLLTWDQQNGLHMDIFKVPTCCSCHIEGYSVSFPPLGHRIHETSSEHFPGEDLSSETGNHAFEAVQSTIQRPTISKTPPFSHSKPESFSPFTDNQNLISGSPFKGKHADSEDSGPPQSSMDSYGNTYFPDSFNQASSIRNVRRPLSSRTPQSGSSDTVTLPSYLEPPTPSASNSFSFVKDSPTKLSKGSPFKRGAFRPSRRPIRKKISGGPDDLISSGSSAVESFTSSNLDSVENFDEYIEEPQIGQASVIINDHQNSHPAPPKRVTIGPKLHAVTTEKISTTPRLQDRPTVTENFTSGGKRINYNYHPIIDFFSEDGKENMTDESIDREDSESYVAPLESEWKPINHPPSRTIPSSNLVSRKKHR